MSACKTASFSWNRVGIPPGSEWIYECWPWQGSLNTHGYGDCQYQGVRMNASRAAYLSVNESIPDGLVVCHTCDNRACCNPAHLRADTQASNLEDARVRRRQVYRTGDKHHRATARLTPEAVAEARARYASGVTQTAIAKELGVSSGAISRAIRGETWGHVK